MNKGEPDIIVDEMVDQYAANAIRARDETIVRLRAAIRKKDMHFLLDTAEILNDLDWVATAERVREIVKRLSPETEGE